MSAPLIDVDWGLVVAELGGPGWSRIQGAVSPEFAAELESEAHGPWRSLPATEGGAGVREAGLVCHRAVAADAGAVSLLASAIRSGIDSAAGGGAPPLPPFNHAEWCRAQGGEKFITAHRDPPTAGGVIAVLTTRGRAPFRVWEIDGTNSEAERHPELAHEWDTADGDLVLLRGGGWPAPTSRCPIHDVRSPPDGERVTLTLRHNKGGYGADYFS